MITIDRLGVNNPASLTVAKNYPRRIEREHELSILELAERYETKKLVAAPHQRRAGVWTIGQCQMWARDLMAHNEFSVLPEGSNYLTYQLLGQDNPDTIWLNDGLQRVSVTADFIKNPSKYVKGVTIPQAREAAKSFIVRCQNRLYTGHLAGLIEFQKANSGTPLTAQQFCFGYLTVSGVDNVNWQPTVEELHLIMAKLQAPDKYAFLTRRAKSRYTTSPDGGEASRQNYQLFFRFFTGKKTLKLPFGELGNKEVKPLDVERGRTVEQQLRYEFNVAGYQQVQKSLAEFDSFMSATANRIATSFTTSWSGKEKNKMSMHGFFSLLEIAIWAKNNGQPTDNFVGFMGALFNSGGFGNNFVYPSPKGTGYVTVAIKLGNLATIENVMKSYFLTTPSQSKAK